MKRLLPLLMCALFLFCSCAYPEKTISHKESEPENSSSVESEIISEDIDCTELFNSGVVFIYGCNKVWVRGSEYQLGVAPFTEDGVLYVPADTVCAVWGGSFVKSGDVYYMNDRGNVTAVMEEYNVMLFGNTSFVMERTPVIKDGIFCLPIDGFSKALSMKAYISPDQEICLLSNNESVSQKMLFAIRKSLMDPLPESDPNSELKALAEECGEDASTIEELALEGVLWYSDENGTIAQIKINAVGELIIDKYEMNAAFPANKLFISKRIDGENAIYDLKTDKYISKSPEELYNEELRSATGRYMELTAASQLFFDDESTRLANAYYETITGDLLNADYQSDLANPYECGLFTASNPDNSWEFIFENARVGDYLLFSSSVAGAEYGYFNHSALIIEKNTDSLRLLHARGYEYGVGADLEMDILTKASFENVDYYTDYSTVFLCRAGNLDSAQSEKLASDAYEKYNNYQFGYGGRMGLEEVNCTELIDDAYLNAGVDIIDGDYDSRLKEVLKGNTQNLVLIPDDLMFSEKTKVVAVWQR